MLRVQGLNKTFVLHGRRTVVARDLSFEVPRGAAIALLGRNGAGKSTLLQMIAGSILPDSGRIEIEGSVSWPVGFQGSFHRDLTGAQNTRFLARVYGVDTREYEDFVEDFAELGTHFHQPVRSYSSGMRSRLGFACSMGIHFDTYLIDEVTAVGDAEFRAKSAALLQDRLRHSGAIFVSHSMTDVRRICNAGIVLDAGNAYYYGTVEKAIDRHEKNMKYKS